MSDLITAQEAQLSLRLDDDLDAADTADLAMAIAQAQAIYREYHPDGEWADDSPVLVPDTVKAAVLILLHALWDNRGENPIAKAYDLMRLNRGPALA